MLATKNSATSYQACAATKRERARSLSRFLSVFLSKHPLLPVSFYTAFVIKNLLIAHTAQEQSKQANRKNVLTPLPLFMPGL